MIGSRLLTKVIYFKKKEKFFKEKIRQFMLVK